MSYPRAYIELVRDTVPLSLVVRSFDIYVQPENERRKIYRCRCPFHQEKTASFLILDQRGIYRCFGCGEHGDVFTFVMRMRGSRWEERKGEFIEAVKYVGERWEVYPVLARKRRRERK